jgi:hypothetical protein
MLKLETGYDETVETSVSVASPEEAEAIIRAQFDPADDIVEGIRNGGSWSETDPAGGVNWVWLGVPE